MILRLMDADEDCPAALAPRVLSAAPTAPLSCVFAKREFESWFIASLESMKDNFNVTNDSLPIQPEKTNLGKGWLERRFVRGNLEPTIHQARLTHRIDLALCRENSPSFAKLLREIDRFVQDIDASE